DFMQTEPTEKYDAVVACGVFDYVKDAESFLRHMSRFANKVIYGSFPGWSLVRSPLRKVRYALRGCPTHFYRIKTVRRIFDDVGFGRTVINDLGGGCLAWGVRE
ncbi:unnamed protein product, partial [marine sediment metagenome]